MKRIFVCHRPDGAFGFISDGWINAMRDRGFAVQRWDGNYKSWEAFKPDLYIGASGHRQELPIDSNCIKAMHVNPYGPIDCGNINESKDARYYINMLQPKVVFGYGFDADEVYWQYWKEKLGIPWVPMPTGADVTVFKSLTSLDARHLDAIYIGGRWAYKATVIDEYLIPMMRSVQAKHRSVEIYGWGEWAPGDNRGIIPNEKVVATFNRAKIGPCISEPHTHKWGFDLPERVWKVAACGCLPIHDPVPTLRQILPSLPMAKSAAEYADLHYHYMQNSDERIPLAKELYYTVMNAHTYHHRIATLFRSIGWENEARQMVSKD